jgi:hypothetical protein
MKWLVRSIQVAFGVVAIAIIATIFFPGLILVGFLAVAWVGDATDWYHVEDDMCMSQDREACKELIAEKRRLREKTAPKSN